MGSEHRVLVAGGLQRSIDALQARLGKEPHRYWVVHAKSAEEALDYAQLLKPDIVLAQSGLRHRSEPLEAIISQTSPVLLMAEVRPAYEYRDMLKAGAKGYIPIDFADNGEYGGVPRVINTLDRLMNVTGKQKDRVLVKGTQLTPRLRALQEQGLDVVIANSMRDVYDQLLNIYTPALFFDNPQDPAVKKEDIENILDTCPYLTILNLDPKKHRPGPRVWYTNEQRLEESIPLAVSMQWERVNRDLSMSEGGIWVITGPSASKKSTAGYAITQAIPTFSEPPRYKTRGPRPFEINGIDSIFTDEATQRSLYGENPDAFLFYFRHLIGREGYDTSTGYSAALPKKSVDDALAKGNDVLIILANPDHVGKIENSYPGVEKAILSSSIKDSIFGWRDRGTSRMQPISSYRENAHFRNVLRSGEWQRLEFGDTPTVPAAAARAFMDIYRKRPSIQEQYVPQSDGSQSQGFGTGLRQQSFQH